GVTANGPVTNEGILTIVQNSSFNAAFTNPAGAVLRIQPNGESGATSLTIANGFTNHGFIELTSAVGAYNAGLVVSAGSLVNAADGVIRSLPGTGGARTLSARLDNAGDVHVQHPMTLSVVDGAATNSGWIAVDANLSVAQSGSSPSFTTSGFVVIDSGRTFQSSNGS